MEKHGHDAMMDDLKITEQLSLPVAELSFEAIRAQGAGGQNVNKVATAIHLRFDIGASSLPDTVKTKLMQMRDQRITREGVVVIKAQTARSQAANREIAMDRLRELIVLAMHVPKHRRPTRPTLGSQRRRLESKQRRGQLKQARGKISHD